MRLPLPGCASQLPPTAQLSPGLSRCRMLLCAPMLPVELQLHRLNMPLGAAEEEIPTAHSVREWSPCEQLLGRAISLQSGGRGDSRLISLTMTRKLLQAADRLTALLTWKQTAVRTVQEMESGCTATTGLPSHTGRSGTICPC